MTGRGAGYGAVSGGLPKGWYIAAWICAALAANILLAVIDTIVVQILDGMNVTYHVYYVSGAITTYISLSIVWIVVYRWFSLLNIRKVMPWLWGLGLLGAFWTIGQIAAQLDEHGLEMPAYLPLLILGSVICSILTYQHYFKRQPGRWR